MRGGRVVAIHQPNFFPWLGYFNKIAHADVFVILDNVQFSKTGGTWSNRVRLIINGKPSWVTMPVVRAYEGVRLVRNMVISETSWRSRLLQTLRYNYRRASQFEKVYPVLATLIDNPVDHLAEYNLFAIRALTEALRFDSCQLVLGSTLHVEGRATELLVAVVKAVGGTAYLCGGGTAEYQEDEKFVAGGIDLIYQDFKHPIYPQANSREFVPGLSIIDALMNCGFDQTRRLIMSSEPALSNRARSGSVATR